MTPSAPPARLAAPPGLSRSERAGRLLFVAHRAGRGALAAYSVVVRGMFSWPASMGRPWAESG